MRKEQEELESKLKIRVIGLSLFETVLEVHTYVCYTYMFLASFFLPSHLSFKNMYIIYTIYVHNFVHIHVRTCMCIHNNLLCPYTYKSCTLIIIIMCIHVHVHAYTSALPCKRSWS